MPNVSPERDQKEAAQLLADLRRWMDEFPGAGVIVATAELSGSHGDEHVRVEWGSIDCTPVLTVAFAEALLERASEGLRALATNHPQALQPLQRVEQARAHLNFFKPTGSTS